jgi:phosphate starvation-inducible PhoH-like protein
MSSLSSIVILLFLSFISFSFSKKIKTSNLFKYKLSPNQIQYKQYLDDQLFSVIVAVGPAGTGKTMLACEQAIYELNTNKINKIIITRPTVTAGEELGFLPGGINQKMDPWTRPIFDIFNDHFSKQTVKSMLADGVIEITPLAFMRGRTFTNSFIIADEMQNSTPNQMIMLTTRVGFDTRLVITGDPTQCDLQKDNYINGLSDLLYRLDYFDSDYIEKQEPFFGIVELDGSDIRRSAVVEKIIKIYDKKNQ